MKLLFFFTFYNICKILDCYYEHLKFLPRNFSEYFNREEPLFYFYKKKLSTSLKYHFIKRLITKQKYLTEKLLDFLQSVHFCNKHWTVFCILWRGCWLLLRSFTNLNKSTYTEHYLPRGVRQSARATFWNTSNEFHVIYKLQINCIN